MTPMLDEILSVAAIGALCFALTQVMLSAAKLLCVGYAPKYLKLSCMPHVKLPRTVSKSVSWIIDFLATVLVCLILTVYDCGVLGGVMRFPHFAVFLMGYAFATVVYRRLLGKALSCVFSVALELLLLPIGLISYPFRLLFAAFFAICRRLVLRCVGKYAKMKEKRTIRRYTALQLGFAETAFLPKDAGDGRQRTV